MEGLERPPYPGAKGQEVYDSISKQAWQEWIQHQTMLINEQHLNLMDPSNREFLQIEMEKFMKGEDYTSIEGFTPPEK